MLDGQQVKNGESFRVGRDTIEYPGDHRAPGYLVYNCRCTLKAVFPDSQQGPRRARTENGTGPWEIVEPQSYREWAAEKQRGIMQEQVESAIQTSIMRSSRTNIAGIQYYAYADDSKFTQYALNPDRDSNKATAFKEALGFDLDNWQILRDIIINSFDESELIPSGENEYGKLFYRIIQITGPNGKTANVKTAWIKRIGESEYRLTTCHVYKGK